MGGIKREFDQYSDSYEQLLKDPVRDRFMSGDSQFFHVRKRDLIRAYFRKRSVNTGAMAYLDLGCGKGELAGLLRQDFKGVCGCDPSPGMLAAAHGIETKLQVDPGLIPYPNGAFDFVSAVCVYHHVPVEARGGLTAEVARVLKPGGTFVMIEHNPYNPVTRLIVKRTPVDAEAILLKPRDAKGLLAAQGLSKQETSFFLYLPERLYQKVGALERWMEGVPLGGQYAVWGCLASDSVG